MFENSFFISYPELFLYKYVSRETLKRVKHRFVTPGTRIKVMGA